MSDSLPSVFLPGATGDWFVLHSRSRCEKVLADELNAQSIPHFLPLLRQTKYYGRRKVTVNEPLFPGYLFLRGTIADAYLASGTKRVANILTVADQNELDSELRGLFVASACGARLDPHSWIAQGVEVEVSAGPMRGLRGVVAEHGSYDRLILQVNMLGTAVSLEIGAGLLRHVAKTSCDRN